MPALYEPHPLPDLCSFCHRVATHVLHDWEGHRDPVCEQHGREWAFPWLDETLEEIKR